VRAVLEAARARAGALELASLVLAGGEAAVAGALAVQTAVAAWAIEEAAAAAAAQGIAASGLALELAAAEAVADEAAVPAFALDLARADAVALARLPGIAVERPRAHTDRVDPDRIEPVDDTPPAEHENDHHPTRT
jgi:hypothetical protein